MTLTTNGKRIGRPRTGKLPRIAISLPPLILLELRRQSRAGGVTMSRWVERLVQNQSAKP